MAWTGVITNRGAALLDQWALGGTLTITGAATGTGTVAEAAMLTQTDLVSRKQTASIVAKEMQSTGLKVKLQITAPQTGYTLQQYGVWAKLGTGDPVLLALFQKLEGVVIPSAAETPDFVYTLYALLTVSNTGELEVTVDPSALVTYSTMEDYVEAVTADMAAHLGRTDNPHQVTPAQLGLDKVLDGVETLGPAELVSFQDAHGGLPMESCIVGIGPAQSGSGNPTPANIRPISGRENVKVWRFGKNFFPQADVTFNVREGNKTVNFPHPLPAGPYTFSADLTSTYNGNCIVHILRGDNTSIQFSLPPGTRVSASFTSAEGNEIKGVRFYIGDGYSTSYNNTGAWSNIQVETGSTATAYEASETVVDADLPELVYGGTLDVLTGKLTVTHGYIKPSEYTGSSISDTMVVVFTHIPLGKHGLSYNIVSNVATGAARTNNNIARYGYVVDQSIVGTSPILFIAASTTAHPTTASLSQALLDADACFAYDLETPEVYQLTPSQVASLVGQNRIWADAGNITVEYGAFLQALQAEIERLNQQTNQRAKKNVLAGVEESTTATTNYAVGDFLIVKDSLYKVTAAIAAGETITVDTNVQETTIAQQLKALFASV